MKLRSNTVTMDVDGTRFLVPVGAEAFRGVARSNETAAFILDCLAQETTEDAIVDAMCAKYNAPRDQIAADVREILDTLRRINALDESDVSA